MQAMTRAPWTFGRDHRAPENAAHVAPLPWISIALMVHRRGDRGKTARRLSAPRSSLERARPYWQKLERIDPLNPQDALGSMCCRKKDRTDCRSHTLHRIVRVA